VLAGDHAGAGSRRIGAGDAATNDAIAVEFGTPALQTIDLQTSDGTTEGGGGKGSAAGGPLRVRGRGAACGAATPASVAREGALRSATAPWLACAVSGGGRGSGAGGSWGERPGAVEPPPNLGAARLERRRQTLGRQGEEEVEAAGRSAGGGTDA